MLSNISGSAVFDNVRIDNCSAPKCSGGAINNLSKLYLTNTNITNCYALYGGAIYNSRLASCSEDNAGHIYFNQKPSSNKVANISEDATSTSITFYLMDDNTNVSYDSSNEITWARIMLC